MFLFDGILIRMQDMRFNVDLEHRMKGCQTFEVTYAFLKTAARFNERRAGELSLALPCYRRASCAC
jgi:hypothetical protein